MKKIISWILAMACLFVLTGCHQEQPTESHPENWSGTITDIFTEGRSTDRTEVIALQVEDHDPMYFTIVENTGFFRYDSAAKEAKKIDKTELSIGDWVEIECESSQNAGYRPILSIRVIDTKQSDSDTVLKEPPTLTVTCGETSIKALLGGYSWVITGENGASTASIVDSAHPLQCRELMQSLMPEAHTVSLMFDDEPDAVHVRCWSEELWSGYDADNESEELTVSLDDAGGFRFDLKDGNYIYEVVAEWNDSRAYSGTANYSFCTEDRTT